MVLKDELGFYKLLQRMQFDLRKSRVKSRDAINRVCTRVKSRDAINRVCTRVKKSFCLWFLTIVRFLVLSEQLHWGRVCLLYLAKEVWEDGTIAKILRASNGGVSFTSG
ncbi:MAG: hypothetical protein KME40_13645 [Komarekiella atlantica HA4396-MV6]|jgi:hypothetical protein|nr:hypothetical protein [Komarekiella atlantica HA4396-MV6]